MLVTETLVGGSAGAGDLKKSILALKVRAQDPLRQFQGNNWVLRQLKSWSILTANNTP